MTVMIVSSLNSVHNAAKDAIIKAQKQHEAQVNKRIKSTKDKPPFLIGDIVLRYRKKAAQNMSAKLENRYDVPFYIHVAYNNLTYSLKTPNGTLVPRRVYGNKSKIYKEPGNFFNPLFFQRQDGPSLGFLPPNTSRATGNIRYKPYEPKPSEEE
ncbi:hypothetical protein EDC96DRAFT_549807 [Choanephora cucurbitarum]|nr:hypothetical protein EDC96DRAFT_549807 [Choanephora cucurbitarum]